METTLRDLETAVRITMIPQQALQSANLRWPALPHYASRATIVLTLSYTIACVRRQVCTRGVCRRVKRQAPHGRLKIIDPRVLDDVLGSGVLQIETEVEMTIVLNLVLPDL
jgi:hypothetical protein